MIDPAELLALYRRYDAFLEGHFLLTSGLHSPHYFQCARILQHPQVAERLGRELAEALIPRLEGRRLSAVLSPAMGGLIIGHELGRALDCRAIFAERQEGRMTLRRFQLAPDEAVVVVEDVVTTGGSLFETARLAESSGARVLAVACLVDRSSGRGGAELERLVSLVRVDARTFPPEDCPLCRQGLPLVKPGSRTAATGAA